MKIFVMKHISVIGLPIAATNYAGAVVWVLERARAGTGTYAVEAANTHVAALARSNRAFGQALARVDLICPDGMPLVWASRLKGTPLPQRVAGSDLISTLSAAAAGRIAGLNDDRMADAICLAAIFAGGLREFVTAGTDEFPLHAGMAARNGIHAVQCALTGVHAARSTIGGNAGFMRAFGEPGKAYSARLAVALGEQYELVRTTYKPYPACQFNRSVIRGMLTLRAAQAVPLSGITIRLHPFEADFVGMRHTGPFVSFPQTFMSAPFCAALAWVDGAVTYRAMHDFDREPVVRLAGRVRVVADASIPHYRPRLTIETGDGRILEWAEDQGEERYAMTWESAVDMTRIFCDEAGVAPQDADALIEATRRLDQSTDCEDFLSALHRAHARAHA